MVDSYNEGDEGITSDAGAGGDDDDGRETRTRVARHLKGTISSRRLTLSTTGESRSKTALDQATKLEQISKWSLFRFFVLLVIDSELFSGFIFATIFSNSVVIVLQISGDMVSQYSWFLTLLDNVFLGIYLAELTMKIYVWRREFFHSGWNVFDLGIVGTSLMEVLIMTFLGAFARLNPKILRMLRLFRSIRAVRALRVLRTITMLRSLQVIVNTLIKSLPAMGSIFVLTLLVTYVYAIIGVSLYKQAVPRYFGSIPTAAFTLFQVMTLDNWFDIYYAGRNYDPVGLFFYLASAIIVENITMINLLVAVICSNLTQAQEALAKKRNNMQKKQRIKIEKHQTIDRVIRHEAATGSVCIPSQWSGVGGVKPGADVIRIKKRTAMAVLLQGALESQIEQYQSLEQVHDGLCMPLRNQVEKESFQDQTANENVVQ